MITQFDSTILLSTLTRARDLIQQGWCQGDYAQYEDGSLASVGNPEACKWSITGATYTVLLECSRTDLLPRINGYLHGFLPLGINYPEDYNDLPTTTQADVLALLDRAIEEVKL